MTTSTPVMPRAGHAGTPAGGSWRGQDTHRLLRLLAVVAGLHVVGWGVLALLVAPQDHVVGDQVFGLGLGLTAYAFGVRHAFDVDHIGVIDGATRKLTADGKRPLSVGFWFSLGHSSVVFAMALLVATGARLASSLVQEGSAVHTALSTFGTGAAGFFLWVVGLVNLVALVGILRTRRRFRSGRLTAEQLDASLATAGALSRLLGRFTRRINHPAQAYPVGLLMGLGFDTATEVALLVLAGTAAVTLPWYAVLVLPVLFAAGMSLFDTLDGAFMTAAYDWAFARPLRKLTYNAVVTGLSVAVALVVGTIQLVSVLHDRLGLDDVVTTWISGLDLSRSGLLVVAGFVLAWVAALAWRRRPTASEALHERQGVHGGAGLGRPVDPIQA
ncbi:HoxN/HupN/NixA family nickel/cobalt transporter [Blastococcus mobilis]|uniref:Nickel/cobalt efflux system n=1 Tax=Blastococcus mobilis TaxID=1938746 RepID=A0A238W5U1_9ACTN|nr:HoxN/HupN/NixA family nickel/cobalt transporter [Blastococcus mobilis]SNR41922.1 high-affinity nickel-transport protein [Blastococcus mobilis]